ncbi:MAG TPA: PIN domain-containing protein [Bryobacteraceae bacterium]|jgi:predicted nucleic acid-binding protein
MTGLYFVDSNVLVYALDTANPQKQAAALRWRDALWQSQSGHLSWQVLHEFFYSATRKLHISEAVVRALVRSYAQWPVTGFSLSLIELAWYWTDRAQLNYWDALILAAAERSGCRWLLSEDFTHKRKYGSVEAVNPFLTEPNGFGAA